MKPEHWHNRIFRGPDGNLYSPTSVSLEHDKPTRITLAPVVPEPVTLDHRDFEKLFTEVDPPFPERETIRVDGKATCPYCGRRNQDHDWDYECLDPNDRKPFLRRGCNGVLLKL